MSSSGPGRTPDPSGSKLLKVSADDRQTPPRLLGQVGRSRPFVGLAIAKRISVNLQACRLV